ncbi:MAG TPA: antitoxin [Candidatus Marinimicrobia bacterium]|nr:antitoxin [Candidatus Neomarinimicrobiota bacterium]
MDKAKIFKNGRSQAVRLPKKYRFEGDEVYIKQSGNVVVLIPKDNPWKDVFESVKMFSDDFMETREQPPLETRESVD